MSQPLGKGQLGHRQRWGDAQAEMSRITSPPPLGLTLSAAKVVLKKLVLGPFRSATLPKGCANLSSEPPAWCRFSELAPCASQHCPPTRAKVSFSHRRVHLINGLGGRFYLPLGDVTHAVPAGFAESGYSQPRGSHPAPAAPPTMPPGPPR